MIFELNRNHCLPTSGHYLFNVRRKTEHNKEITLSKNCLASAGKWKFLAILTTKLSYQFWRLLNPSCLLFYSVMTILRWSNSHRTINFLVELCEILEKC